MERSPELLVTITFRVPQTEMSIVGRQVEPVMRAAMAVGGNTAHIDITVYEEKRPAEKGVGP
jgi:hypothetical protein